MGSSHDAQCADVAAGQRQHHRLVALQSREQRRTVTPGPSAAAIPNIRRSSPSAPPQKPVHVPGVGADGPAELPRALRPL
jgi:hypothetical protein